MAPLEKPKNNEVVTITLPPDTTKALQELQGSFTNQNLAKLKDDVESRNVQQKMKTVFTQLDSLAVEHPELVSTIEDIKAYLVLLQHGQKPDVKDATDVALNFTRSYQSRHVRIAPVGEPKTSGGVSVRVPTTTVAGTDAAGYPVANYGDPQYHSDIYSSPEFLASAERGRELLAGMPLEQINTVKQNTEILQKVDETNKPAKEGAGVKEIRETLKEINPETLEKAVTISETFINLVPEGQTKTTLQGIHGAIILDMIRQAGHNLNIINNKVTIEPKPGVDIVNLQTKLQTLVNTGRLSIDTLKTGLLYSSPIFKKYSDLKVTKGMIDPSVNAKDFLEYVNNRQKTGENSPDIRSLIASASMLEGVNFTQAIKGFQDLGQISPWLTQNPGTVHAVGAGVTNINATTQNAPSVGGQANNTTITGSISQDGVTGGRVSSTLSMAGQGFVQGFGDIMKLGKGDPIATLGIGAALFYGVYKMFKQFGFLGGIAGFLGLGAINNWEKIGDNLSGLGDVAKKTAAKVEEGIDHLRGKTGSSASPDKPAESSEKPAEVTEDQKYLREQTLQNTALSGKIDQLSDLQKKYNKPAIGKIGDYITYIETNLKDTPLTQIFPDDHKESIYYDTGKTPISVPPNLDSKMLKAVLRSYLGGSGIDSISGTGDTAGVVDKQKFMDTYGITPEDIKTKKLTDILSVIHQKRKVNAQPSNSPPSQAASPQSSPPSNSPPAAASVAPTNTGEKLVVGGLEIVKRMNVQIDKNAQVYDAQGNNMAANFLKKDPSGNTYLPKDEVVVVTSNTIKIGKDLYAEIEHTGTTMYIRVQNLKQITI